MKKAFTLIELLVVIAIVAMIAAIICGGIDGCNGPFSYDDNIAINTLETAGYSDVRIVDKGIAWFNENDSYEWQCEAYNPKHQKVTVYVTYNYGKGATIRYK